MTSSGSRFESDKLAAWLACKPFHEFDPTLYRVDAYGNVIRWDHYGTQSEQGWEIDHVLPSALGGADHVANYRALHWRANRQLGARLGNQINAFTGRKR
jgi:hypothetical protein